MTQKRNCPAPRANADRAEIIYQQPLSIIAKPELEADFPAIYIARRYGLALPLARVVAALVYVGGGCA